jgi:hypothetical protein
LIQRHNTPSRSLPLVGEQKLKKLVQDTLSKLEIRNGPSYFQIKLENGLPYLIEVTPRLDGCHMWRLLKAFYSIDLLDITLQHLMGENVRPLFKRTTNISNEAGYTLEFLCEKPECAMPYDVVPMTDNIIFSRMYYEKGKMIPSVNGLYEKCGYVIKKKVFS